MYIEESLTNTECDIEVIVSLRCMHIRMHCINTGEMHTRQTCCRGCHLVNTTM